MAMFPFTRMRAIGRFEAPPRAERPCVESGRAVGASVAGRDLRIDLIRGLALWMIFVDHITGNPLNRITYGHFGLADALDIFVFLSGMSCGILYGKLIVRCGFVAAGTRALRRVGQLYVANVLLGFINLASYFAFRPFLDSAYLVENDLVLLARDPWTAIGGMVGLFYTPQMMDILPLYMVLLLVTPAFVLLLTRSETAALALSASLWLAAAAIPELTIPSLGSTGAASFDPFSWQILFCLGLWLGKRHYVDGVPFRPRRSLLALCWVIVAIGFATRHAGFFSGAPEAFAWATEPSVLRTHIHPARLADFLACAYLVAAYLRADSGLVRSRWTEPLRVCGRHSLEVFCAGGVVSIPAGAAVAAYGPRLSIEAIATLAGVAAMIAVAWFMDHRRARRRRARDVAPERRLQRAGAGT